MELFFLFIFFKSAQFFLTCQFWSGFGYIIFKDQFPGFVNTFHYQICACHPKLGYFLVDPTWQQMLRPNSRKPDNPNILILHIKHPNQNLEIDHIAKPY